MTIPLPAPGSKSLRDYLASVIRTVVPIGVGILLTWLGTKVGIPIPEDVRWIVVGGVMAGYHALVRAAETRWRWVGWFLGLATSPVYPTEPKESGAVRSDAVEAQLDSPPDYPPTDGAAGGYHLHIRGPGLEGWLIVARQHVVRRSLLAALFHRGRHTPWALGR